jgi:hypothetical protein
VRERRLSATDYERLWRDAPLSLKIELLAEVHDAREWRFGPDRPPWLPPAWLSAVQLMVSRSR